MEMQAGQTSLWPLAVYTGAVFLLAAVMLVSSYLLGPRHMARATAEPYESGIRPTGRAWMRFDVKYYLIAMFFVIFDVETIFIYAWAIGVVDAGWSGFVQMGIFIGVLLTGLAYLWRMGALDWAVFARRTSNRGRA